MFLKLMIDCSLNDLLKIEITLFFNNIFRDSMIRQIGKWSQISPLRIVLLKFVSVYQLVKIQSMAVAVLLITLVGLFMIGVMRFS